MDIRNRRALKDTAAQALNRAPGNPRNVVLAYAGISCLLTLLVTVISWVLSDRIADTGGLGNMGLRSILSTGQTVVPLVETVVMMGLGVGYNMAVLNMARGKETEPGMLISGFSRFGPMLRYSILIGIMYFGIAVVSAYIACYIFLFLPISEPFYEIMEPLMRGNTLLSTGLIVDDATFYAMAEALKPMLAIWGGIALLMLIPVHYQYRMAPFCIADEPRVGALAAMGQSRAMMRRNRFALFKLDLNLWWYYLLQLLVTVICYGDVLLPKLGVVLPFSETVAYFLFLVLSLIAQMAVAWFAMNRVNVTYAVAYDSLRPKPEPNKGVAIGNIFNM